MASVCRPRGIASAAVTTSVTATAPARRRPPRPRRRGRWCRRPRRPAVRRRRHARREDQVRCRGSPPRRPVGAVPVKCWSCTPSSAPDLGDQAGLLGHLPRPGRRRPLAVVDAASGQGPVAGLDADRATEAGSSMLVAARTTRTTATRCPRVASCSPIAARTQEATVPAAVEHGRRAAPSGRPPWSRPPRPPVAPARPPAPSPRNHPDRCMSVSAVSRPAVDDPAHRVDPGPVADLDVQPGLLVHLADHGVRGSSPKSIPPPGSVHQLPSTRCGASRASRISRPARPPRTPRPAADEVDHGPRGLDTGSRVHRTHDDSTQP